MRKRYQQGSLQRRKQGRHWVWVALWRDGNGSRRYKTLGRCSEMAKGEARAGLLAIVAPLNERTDPGREPQTFQGFVQRTFLPFYRRKWKPSTASTTERRIRHHLLGELGSQKMSEIHRDELQGYLDRVSQRGLSFSTVDHLRWDLRSIFEMAQNDGIVSRNPAKVLYTPREAKRAAKRVMNGQEVLKCLGVLEPREHLIVRLAIFAGMREGEIFALFWEHIKSDHVEVRQRLYEGKLDSPKSVRSFRIVGLSPSLIAELDAWRAQVVNTSPEEWVFPSERMTALRPENVWRRHIGPKLKAIGLGWVNFQVMRRTHASLSRKAGNDLKVVADQMGHGLGVNVDVYTRTDLEQLIDHVRKLESDVLIQ